MSCKDKLKMGSSGAANLFQTSSGRDRLFCFTLWSREGVPFFQLRWQKSMYFSWEHKSLYHLPPKKKLYLFGHLLKLHSHEIRPNTDFIYFFISQWESSLHFALLERVFVFSPFISHSLCLLFLMRIWKKKRAFLISVDNITRAIFNPGFCK